MYLKEISSRLLTAHTATFARDAEDIFFHYIDRYLISNLLFGTLWIFESDLN